MTTPATTTGRQRSRTTIAVIAVLMIAVLAVIAVVIALVSTATPEFFSRYHLLNRRYVNLGGSAHEGIGCRTCHETNAALNGAQLVGEFYAGAIKRGELPTYFEFGPPRNEACLKCHVDEWNDDASRTRRIPHAAHPRVASEERDCVGCHKWTAHLEDYMKKHEQMPFSGLCAAYECHVGTKKQDQCLDCHHVLGRTAKEWDTEHREVVRATGKNGCLESCHTVTHCQTCHTTGEKPKMDGPAVQVSPAVEELHAKPEWTTKYHGAEALKNRDECLLCHQSQGECQECHRYRPAFHGKPLSWIGQHGKSAKSVTDPRCIECHTEAYCEECHDQFEEME